MTELKITNPCNQNWNSMSPNELGRYCQLCEKTVIDFTKMSPEEIKVYLKKNGNRRICGRIPRVPIKRIPSKKEQWFNSLRLKINQRIAFRPIRYSLLSLLSVLMVLFGCNQNVAENKYSTKDNPSATATDSIANDSTQRIDELHTVGNIARPEPLMGDVESIELGEVDEWIDEIPIVGKITIDKHDPPK